MITTLMALLASTTFIIWGTIVLVVLMTLLLEFEKEGWATTFFSLGMALWIWNFGCEIWGYVSTNPTSTISFIVGYVVVGIIWSILKWGEYVRSVFNKGKEVKDEFIEDFDVIDEKNWYKFIQRLTDARLKDSHGYSISFDKADDYEKIAKRLAPSAIEKKAIITAWISYWPVSLLGTLLNNPFRKFFQMIYNSISGLYDKITNHYQKNAFGK